MNDTALVLTPLLYGAPAIELANRQWRKRILPIGSVEYKGRQLHFTEDYLRKLCEAFDNRAYDQVSFQLADSQNTHTNDPERHRGYITGLQLAEDGLYATAQVTEAGERILSENPQLGVSARIVENYQRSDGQFYPAAIQHVLGTLDPRIPQLGAWAPVDMANGGGQLVVDLSGSTWAGEPGPSWDLAMAAVGARLSSADPAGVVPARAGRAGPGSWPRRTRRKPPPGTPRWLSSTARSPRTTRPRRPATWPARPPTWTTWSARPSATRTFSAAPWPALPPGSTTRPA